MIKINIKIEIIHLDVSRVPSWSRQENGGRKWKINGISIDFLFNNIIKPCVQ